MATSLNSGDWNRIKRYTTLLSIPGQLVATATLFVTHEISSQFGVVNYFVEVHGEFEGHSEQDVFAIISVLNVERFGHCPHMYVAELTGFMKPVLPSCIISKCVYVSVSSRVYVGSFPCNVLHVLT